MGGRGDVYRSAIRSQRSESWRSVRDAHTPQSISSQASTSAGCAAVSAYIHVYSGRERCV